MKRKLIVGIAVLAMAVATPILFVNLLATSAAEEHGGGKWRQSTSAPWQSFLWSSESTNGRPKSLGGWITLER